MTFASSEAGIITSWGEHSQLADMEEGHNLADTEDKEDVLAHTKEEAGVLVDWSTSTDADALQ